LITWKPQRSLLNRAFELPPSPHNHSPGRKNGVVGGCLYYEKLPGYGYVTSLALSGSDIFAAGKNVIYRNGNVIHTLPAGVEVSCIIVK